MTQADGSGRPAGRVWNFSAGPAALPDPVVERVQQEFPNWQGSGMSVMEMSHRGAAFKGIAERAEADFRSLLSIPDSHAVLFLQGGATLQFAMVPLNLLGDARSADYFRTGLWSEKAVSEAQRFCAVHLPVDTRDSGYRDLPDPTTWQLDPGAAYLHYTTNETINGVQFHAVPDPGPVPLVADMSSDILSRRIDVAQHALIYAGAQKNIGPAGLTLVIVRKDVLGNARPGISSLLDYALHEQAGSMLNTPPTLGWYIAGLVFEWLIGEGGIDALAARNARKAKRLYDFIDASGFYDNPVAPADRSLMNVPFTLADASLESRFVDEASKAGLKNLSGHRSIGGMRASIYNAMPEAGVEALVEFMQDFEHRNG